METSTLSMTPQLIYLLIQAGQTVCKEGYCAKTYLSWPWIVLLSFSVPFTLLFLLFFTCLGFTSLHHSCSWTSCFLNAHKCALSNSLYELEEGINFNVIFLCDALAQKISMKLLLSNLLGTGGTVCKVGLFCCSTGVLTFEQWTVTG